MKALIYTNPTELIYRESPDPTARDGDSLVKIDSVGICGSDMHAFLGHDDRRPAPLILGHEASGITSEGRRVTVNPLVSCGMCDFCLSGRDNICPTRQIISMPPREGAFAEWLSIPSRNLITVPEHVPLNKASLTEPIACGWHAVRLGRESTESDELLVIGGGAIGVGAALSARAQGISRVQIIEPNPLRRDYLNRTIDIKTVDSADLPDASGFALVVDAVGYKETRALASSRVRPGGTILHIGLGSGEGGLDIRRITLQEITFMGTYTYRSVDFIETAEAIFAGKLGTLDWIEERPLSEGQQAFEDIRSGQVAVPKIILKPH